jgi:hypothetical protein
MKSETPDTTSASGLSDNRATTTASKSARLRQLKWTITIMVALSMIGKPQLLDWVNASILYYNHPSFYYSIDVFFTSIPLLYYMILGGYAAWAFLSNLQRQGRGQTGTIRVDQGRTWFWAGTDIVIRRAFGP